MQNANDRTRQLSQLKAWDIQGKIAFIQPGKRERASLNWQYQQEPLNQKLNLTSYLGINVLHLASENGQHKVEVDGEEYQSDDLEYLIYSLTGLTLPTEALSYWLKGIPYLKQDKLEYDELTQLPSKLTSRYNGQHWQVKYGKYQIVNQYRLATSFTISQSELTIKILVNKWTT